MTNSITKSNAVEKTLPWRKSMAIWLFGIAALFTYLNLDHHRNINIQQDFSGHAEAIPSGDIAFLLHQESVLHRLVGLGLAGGADTNGRNGPNGSKDEQTKFWYLLVDVNLTFYNISLNLFRTTALTFFHPASRTQPYSPRAPPRI